MIAAGFVFKETACPKVGKFNSAFLQLSERGGCRLRNINNLGCSRMKLDGRALIAFFILKALEQEGLRNLTLANSNLNSLNLMATGLVVATIVVQCCPLGNQPPPATQTQRDSITASTPSPIPTNPEKSMQFPSPTPTPAATKSEDKTLPACVQSDCNCTDFKTKAEAQAVLKTFPNDPHNLDKNKDGVACESLP